MRCWTYNASDFKKGLNVCRDLSKKVALFIEFYVSERETEKVGQEENEKLRRVKVASDVCIFLSADDIRQPNKKRKYGKIA